MARPSSLFGTITTIGLISFIIFFHELGHFTACKIFNVPTPTFSIGFGPPLLQKKIGATTFQLALIPLGGFVSIDAAALANKAYWQKMIIILAGVFNNILLCFCLIFLLSLTHRKNHSATIESIVHDSPAQKAGLQVGDRIISFDDISITQTTTPFLSYLQSHQSQPITLIVKRDGHELTIDCTPASHTLLGSTIGRIGITLEQNKKKESLKSCFIHSAQLMKNILRQLGGLATTSTTHGSSGIVGPLGILSLGNQAFTVGWGIFFFWVALLSAQIGFFNLLPLPFLDGGQAVQFTAQSFVGRQLTAKEASFVNYLMMMILIGLLFWASPKKLKSEK